MAALFPLGSREYAQDLMQSLFAMMTMGIFSYRCVPLKIQASDVLTRRCSHGVKRSRV
jgi:hypothetical protein